MEWNVADIIEGFVCMLLSKRSSQVVRSVYPFRTPHIPFVSEIILGQVENRCILVRRVVPWICHGAAHHGVMGHFMGFDAAGICIYGECHG